MVDETRAGYIFYRNGNFSHLIDSDHQYINPSIQHLTLAALQSAVKALEVADMQRLKTLERLRMIKYSGPLVYLLDSPVQKVQIFKKGTNGTTT